VKHDANGEIMAQKLMDKVEEVTVVPSCFQQASPGPGLFCDWSASCCVSLINCHPAFPDKAGW